jgi:hypothetical protein
LYGRSTDRKNFLSHRRERDTLNNLELCPRRKDGSPVWVLRNASLVEDDEGELTVIGEAYAVIWSFAFKALSVLVLRFKDKSRRQWKVPFNITGQPSGCAGKQYL